MVVDCGRDITIEDATIAVTITIYGTVKELRIYNVATLKVNTAMECKVMGTVEGAEYCKWSIVDAIS